ncbi:MAG TPA: hypothetical protein DDX92_12180 [Flavobacteriales bacterium]|jgi:hypothetical protein|nr:hypothetical protein [Flavobacteriales bacterium]
MNYRSALFVVLLITGFSAAAQDCYMFIPGDTITILKYDNFNNKDKLLSTAERYVKETLDDSLQKLFEVVTVVRRTNGKEKYRNQVSMRCKNGVFSINMRDYLDQDLLEILAESKTTFKSSWVVIPELLDTTKIMPDNLLEITSVDDESTHHYTLRMRNRRFRGVEKVITPAGEFVAYKMSYTMNRRTFELQQTEVTEWMVEDIGVIKAVFYDTEGNLRGTTMLSEIVKKQ